MKKGILIIVVIVLIIIAGVIIFNVVNNDKKENTTANANQLENGYEVEYKGVNVTPGTKFDENAISEEYDFYEIQSCAFEGNDKVYTYSGIEIDVAEVDGVDTVYYVYFLDTEVETEEGIKISDTLDDMLDAYGEDYENSVENSYVYTRGDVNLTFIVENDVITSIEYTLNVNN